MTQLREIRKALTELRSRRQRMRWGTAWAALAVCVLWILVSLFALDVVFRLGVAQRLALFLVSATIAVWATKRFVLPFLGVRESESELALFVERQHNIDTDLVAALQFSQPQAASWGSTQLETAVIQRVAQRTPKLDVFRGLRYETLHGRLKMLAVTMVGVVAIGLMYPQHVRVFFERLGLSTKPYPSRTKIDTLWVNGQLTLRWQPDQRVPKSVKCAQGRPVQFLVHATGELPERGFITCIAPETKEKRTLELRSLSQLEYDRWRQDLSTGNQFALRGSTHVTSRPYLATLPQLLEDFEYSIHLGDTFTDVGVVHMMALPIAEVETRITPPDYVQGVAPTVATSRNVAAVEGSRVDLLVRSLNQKPLQAAVFYVRNAGDVPVLMLTEQGTDGLNWRLQTPNSPLERITQELQYEIQVVDVDGLNLETPLQGTIQLSPDRVPSATIHSVHRVVLPSARPIVEFRVSDDYGIQALRLQLQVQRGSSATEATADQVAINRVFEIPMSPQPLVGPSVRHRGQYVLDLAPLSLIKGDQLQLTLEAIDYRGVTPGRSYLTEPLRLQVTDEAGVLAAITELDEQSEERLSETIQKQLGVEP